MLKIRSGCFCLVVGVTLCLTSKARNTSPRHCGGTVGHVHLAVGPDPSTQMIVTFATLPSRYPAPITGVLVGTSPSDLKTAHMENEEPSSYNITVNKKRANYGDFYYSPYYHHVTISGLKPNSTYYYKPEAHSHMTSFTSKYSLRHAETYMTEQAMLQALEEAYEEEGANFDEDEVTRQRRLAHWPPYDGSHQDCPSTDMIRSFRTAPAPIVPGNEENVSPVSFAIIGDLGQFPNSESTLTKLIQSRDDIDSIILAGDLAYTGMDHRAWDTFFDFLDDYPIADHKPMQIVPGNHDIDKVKAGNEIFLAYEHRFRMPRVHPPILGVYDGPTGKLNMDQPPYPLPYEWGNAYYAYSYGPARFVMISSYASMEPGSLQYEWIVSELSSVDREVTPWLLVTLHTPLYNTFSLHRKDMQIEAAKRNLEPLFIKYVVNLVFSGHIHAYLRTGNVAMDKLDKKGPIHITVGAGGRKAEAPFYREIPEEWVEVRDATIFGYGTLKITNRTHAVWEWIHTGHSGEHEFNELYHSNKTLPVGPATDCVTLENQFYS